MTPLKYKDGEILIQKQSIFINHPDYKLCYKGRLSNNAQKKSSLKNWIFN